jgi:hypothetical protein
LKLSGEDHEESSDFYNIIGLIYLDLKDSKNALEYLKMCHEIREKVLGPEHPKTKETQIYIENLSLI